MGLAAPAACGVEWVRRWRFPSPTRPSNRVRRRAGTSGVESDRVKTSRLLVLLCGLSLPAAAFAGPGDAFVLSVASPADSHLTTPIDTTAYGDRYLSHDLLLRPGQPCGTQNVVLLVKGFTPTPCDSFLGVTRVPGQPITIRTLHRPLADCPPTTFRHF